MLSLTKDMETGVERSRGVVVDWSWATAVAEGWRGSLSGRSSRAELYFVLFLVCPSPNLLLSPRLCVTPWSPCRHTPVTPRRLSRPPPF